MAKEEIQLAARVTSLRMCTLFSGLPASDLERIAGFAQARHLEKGEVLFVEGSVSRGFYVMRAGAVSVHRIGLTGREQVIAVFRAGESFAEASLASTEGYPANARAMEASEVLLIPKAEMLALLGSRPDLALRMLGSMSQHLRVLVGALDDMTLKDVETRLANWVLRRCPGGGGAAPVVVELGMTKTMWAAELGVRIETLSRTLARFREEGLLETRGRAVTVLHPGRLAERLQRNLSGLGGSRRN